MHLDRTERNRADSYPPGIPHGWYQLLDSADVAPGEHRDVRAFGEPWVVFRGASGTIGLLHATCPHLGANLADGHVVGDCLACPFHGWTFGSAGQLCETPHSEGPLPRARARTLPVRELYGLIVAWHGPVEADGTPPYEPDVFPDLHRPDVVRRGRWASRDLRMHQLEFAENAVDNQHFDKLHGAMRVPWLGARIPGVWIDHVAHWEADPDHAHLSHFHDQTRLKVLGRTLPKTDVVGHGTFVGPASLVVIQVSLPDLGKVWIGHTHTPVNGPGEPLLLRVRFTWWSETSVPAAMGWYVVGSWVAQWQIDVAIWERKSHVPQPVLSAGDGPVRKLRRWFSQFYDADVAHAWTGLRPRLVADP